MDPKRRKIYIIIIVVCILGITFVWLFGSRFSSGGSSSTLSTPAPQPSSTSSAALVKPNADGTFPSPAVFPSNQQLDTSLFSSTKFKRLNPYSSTTLQSGDLGRDNPFSPYQ